MADARPFHWEYHPEAPPPEAFRIEGGRPLRGTVQVSGAKNAALKLLAAAVLTGERCRFENVPEIEDVRVLTEVLGDLGVVVDHPAHGVYEIAAGDVDWLFIPLEAAAKMRASFILLGPLLARFGRVIISNPGGDRIGRRPVNLHVDAMRALGAEVDYRNGYYFAKAPGRLRGGEVRFPQVTVMGTENAMLAACLADGHTVITPAAQEPEVDDLIAFLREMGADVERTRPDTIEVHGKRRLRGADHTVVPDRIETGTFVIAAAVTGGHLTLENAACDHVGALIEAMGRMGVPVACGRTSIEVDATGLRPGDLAAIDVETAPYPGLATDLQPPVCVLLTQADGTSRVHEAVFEDRIEWLAELRKLGARIDIQDPHHAAIHGPSRLHGGEASISDLRAGASLILAALAADGPSLIHGAHHVRRGYENIDRKFSQLGASITRSADTA
jgi:UDP-N-acetylglucosamine 1-carboxyvinyltransferase